jgi:hypothetical protein
MSDRQHKMSELHDIRGIPLKDWDIFRIYHFTARYRKRTCYLHKVARLLDGHWFGFDLHQLLRLGQEEAHKYRMSDQDEFEIIEGLFTRDNMQAFWERKRKRVPSAANPA